MLVLTIDVLRWYTAYPCYLRGTTIECLCRQVQTVLRSGHLVITSRESCLVWPLATEVEIGQTAMDMNEALGVLRFLYDAERLKNVYRTSWTSGGQPESVASHTWRLSLMALIFERSFPDVDIGRLLKDQCHERQPPDFDYTFNLEYGRKFTDAVPLAAALRSIIDAETKQKAAQANVYSDRASDE